ncbi:hypothetical protein D3C72_2305040 [compost metagenome]
MMVNRAHFENTFSSQLKGAYLQNNGQHLHNEYAADHDKQKLHFGQNSDSGNAASDAERAHIAHKHLRGMRVID